jgi:hypothetical protein
LGEHALQWVYRFVLGSLVHTSSRWCNRPPFRLIEECKSGHWCGIDCRVWRLCVLCLAADEFICCFVLFDEWIGCFVLVDEWIGCFVLVDE